MSYQTAQRDQLSKKKGVFSWGFVDNVQDLNKQPYYASYIRNARPDGDSIIIRPWHQLLVTLTAWSYPKGIWSYLRTDPSNDRLIVRHNTDATHKLYTITEAGVATSILTNSDIASDNRMTFTNIGDVIYCMNGSDDFGKLSGTTYTTPSTWITNFAPWFSVVFNGSHRASWRSTNPNIVYKSVADNYEDFNSSWSDQFTFEETITWLATNNQALFYFTKNTISVTGFNDVFDSWWTIAFNTRPLEVKEWAVNHASIVPAGSNIYYLTPSNKINIVARWANIDWFETVQLSHREYAGIDKIMETLDPDQTASFWYFLPDKNLIKWHLKTYWASFNDICVVYDVEWDSFYIDWQKYFYDWVHFKGKNYTISMLESKVYRDEYSNDDEWAPIPFEYYTKEFYIADPTIKKILRESRTLLDINELASITQEIWIDWVARDTKTVDSDNIPVYSWGLGTEMVWIEAIGAWSLDDDYVETYILRTKGNLNMKGKKFQRRFRNSVVGSKVRLKDILAKIEVLNPLTSDLTV